jgi:MFS family permease
MESGHEVAPSSSPGDNVTAAAASESLPPAELAPALRARGRRLAIASHLAGMTHRLVYTDQLPTLTLVALGASEAVVGFQGAFEPLGQLLQLPTLRFVGRYRKRTILAAGQSVSVLGGLPLLAFVALAALPPPWGIAITLLSLAVSTAGITVSDTAWFPMLRAYIEPEQTGRFFGILRTAWHLTLIAYFIGAQRWLAARPGSFAALFAVATACGVLRIGLIARLPEPPSERGDRPRIREALALLRHERPLRRYLLGVGLCGAARRAVVPFAIVLMRRVLGLTDGDVVLTTLAYFAGGCVSLYLWGRAVDRLGAAPIFLVTGIGLALLYLAVLGVNAAANAVVPMIAFFFLLNILAAGFGVADTHVMFRLAPVHAPTRHLVVADVTSSVVYGLAPILAGVALDRAVSAGVAPLPAYRVLFVVAAIATVLGLVPLREFRR